MTETDMSCLQVSIFFLSIAQLTGGCRLAVIISLLLENVEDWASKVEKTISLHNEQLRKLKHTYKNTTRHAKSLLKYNKSLTKQLKDLKTSLQHEQHHH